MSLIFISSAISDGNMSLVKGDKKQALKNRQKFLTKHQISLNQISTVIQEMTNQVMITNHPENFKKVADSLITNQKNNYLFISTADCMPIALFDPRNQVISLIHCGKKGLEINIIKKTLNKMSSNFNTQPKDLSVQIGPSIGPCCYVTNLWQQAENQLIKFGVLKVNIYNPQVCTYHNGNYFSHRKTVVENFKNDFRFATILGIKDEK